MKRLINPSSTIYRISKFSIQKRFFQTSTCLREWKRYQPEYNHNFHEIKNGEGWRERFVEDFKEWEPFQFDFQREKEFKAALEKLTEEYNHNPLFKRTEFLEKSRQEIYEILSTFMKKIIDVLPDEKYLKNYSRKSVRNINLFYKTNNQIRYAILNAFARFCGVMPPEEQISVLFRLGDIFDWYYSAALSKQEEYFGVPNGRPVNESDEFMEYEYSDLWYKNVRNHHRAHRKLTNMGEV